MKLSKQAIVEFKQIYFKEFGENITEKQVIEMGTKLINVIELILPLKGSNIVHSGELTKD